MKIALVLTLAAAVTASEVPLTDSSGNYTLHTIWIEGGMAPGVTSGDVPDINTAAFAGTFDQQLDGAWRPGGHAGIEYARTRVDLEGNGWTLGLALWYDSMPGRITAASTPGGTVAVDADLTENVLSLAIAPGLVYRFDDSPLELIAPRTWQIEFAPVLALGAGRATVAGGDPSAWGAVWQAGARVRIHGEIARHLRLGLYAGASMFEAKASWKNTGQATFQGFGPTAGVMLGCEF